SSRHHAGRSSPRSIAAWSLSAAAPATALNDRRLFALESSNLLGQRRTGVELDGKVGLERTTARQANLPTGIYMIHRHPALGCVYYGNCLSSVAQITGKSDHIAGSHQMSQCSAGCSRWAAAAKGYRPDSC